MKVKDDNSIEWGDRITEAMKVSAEKLMAEKKRLNLPIVVSENGVIRVIEAKDIK